MNLSGIAGIETAAAMWIEAFWRACWQGGAFILLRMRHTITKANWQLRFGAMALLGLALIFLIPWHVTAQNPPAGGAADTHRNALRNAGFESGSDGTLESLCHATGQPYLFIDLRHQPRDSWLRASLVARPLGYAPMRGDWSRVVDAFFFTDTMFPSTQDGHVPEGVLTAGRPRASE